MTRHLVTHTRLFEHDPLVIVDVGARWGFNQEWKVFGDGLRVLCFEADKEECERLNASSSANVRYLPYALGGAPGEAVLYHTRLSASTGLYRTNWQYFSRLLNRDNAIVEKEETVRLITLAEALRLAGVPSIDFLKLDVEGAELDVIRGAGECVDSPQLMGVLSEFRFHPEINGSPPFWQLDAHLQKLGFRLFDMHFSHQSRRVLPYEGLADYRLPNGERFFAYTVHGQIMDGDVLYFRDLLVPANSSIRAQAKPMQLLKMACLMELYELSDCAAEVILEHRQRLSSVVDCDRLLDLLTPPLRGHRLRYDQYMRAYFQPRGEVIKAAEQASTAQSTPGGTEGRGQGVIHSMEPLRPGPTSELLEQLKKHSFYHFIDLGDGRETEGWAVARPVQQLVLRQLDRLSFEGKRVLDVGCRDGLFSFYAEKRKAAEVIGIDNSLSSGAVEVLIPYFRSRVRMHEMNLFDLTPDRFGRFDIINFPGVLYHLRYPFLAFKILRNLLTPNGILVLETAILRIHEGTPLLYCPAPKESPYEKTSVTFFNPRGLRDSLASFGYRVEGYDYLHGINAFRLPYTSLRSRLVASGNQLQRWTPSLVRLLLRRYIIDRGVFVCRIDPTLIDPELEDYWNRIYEKVTYD